MAAGLSTPLHLAASLLALAAASGLTLIALAAGRRWDLRLVALGGFAVAVSHGLAGALLGDAQALIGWLRAGGFVLVALGRLPDGLPSPERSSARTPASTGRPASPRVLVPVLPVPAALVGALGAAIAAARAFGRGRSGGLAGGGFLLWAGALVVQHRAPAGAAWLTILGALALGVWLWQSSTRRLLAKLVIAFVASLLMVVVLLAAVLGGVGSRELVDQELARLEERSQRLARQVTGEWPTDAVQAGLPYRDTGERLLAFVPGGRPDITTPEQAERGRLDLLTSLFRSQDFLSTVNAQQQEVYTVTDVESLSGSSLGLALAGSSVVDAVLAGAESASDVLTVGGSLVAVGAVPLRPNNATPEQPPVGVLLIGRVLDGVAASQAADQLGVGVIVEVGGELSAASEGLAHPAALVRAVGEAPRATPTVGGQQVYAAATSVNDPEDARELGRIIAVSPTGALAEVELAQARRLFLLALLGALAAGLIAALLASRLVAPIRRLTAAAAAVREGNLATATHITTADEVGQLGRTFDEMTGSLAAQSAQLRDAATVQSRLRARLEALTSSMSDALVAVDADARVIAFNPAAERLVGHEAAHAVGRPLGEVLHGRAPGDRAPAEALGAPTSEDTTALQVLLQPPGGRPVPTAATAAPVRDPDGHVLGRVYVLRDVTREVEVERMKTEFLSNVSHELRTPLTPIKGYAKMLSRSDLRPEAARQFAREILSSADRMERIVGLIVDFAALDSGRLELEQEPTDMSALVGDVVARWRERHPERDFRRRVPQSLPPALVDPGMVRRCLDELLDNAVKFSPGGEPVSITGVLEPADGEGRPRIRVSVRDRGVGIEQETASRVFRDFYQVDASETRHYGGLGLGLALVRRIADRLGAEVDVESTPGRGSTFHLLLPVADSFVKHSEAPAAATANGAPRRAGKTRASTARKRASTQRG